MSATALFAGLACLWLVLAVVYRKAGSLLKCLAFTAFSGIITLGIVWVVGRFIELPLTVAPLSLAVAGVLGIPGVFCMLLLPLI